MRSRPSCHTNQLDNWHHDILTKEALRPKAAESSQWLEKWTVRSRPSGRKIDTDIRNVNAEVKQNNQLQSKQWGQSHCVEKQTFGKGMLWSKPSCAAAGAAWVIWATRAARAARAASVAWAAGAPDGRWTWAIQRGIRTTASRRLLPCSHYLLTHLPRIHAWVHCLLALYHCMLFCHVCAVTVFAHSLHKQLVSG